MVLVAQPKPDEQPRKVLIIDPHPAARDGLALRLQQADGFQICGEAGDVTTAFQLVTATQPDAVVTDVALSGGSGLDLLRKILDRCPTARVLVWSRYRESIYAERVIRAGAAGYIQKDQPTTAVVEAVRHVLKGKVYLSPAMTDAMLQQAGGKAYNLAADPVEALSDRELEVFRMIAQCRDTQEIAKELHLSLKTIETYRGRIKMKFGADSSAELLRLALQWELENG
jgi:DNA-binding NarL/FixJ family response regulator